VKDLEILFIRLCVISNEKNSCIFVLQFTNRGALNKRAEIKPFEPDPGNAGEGRDTKQMTAFYSYLPSIV